MFSLFPLACVCLQMSERSARAQLAEVQEQLAGLTADHNTALDFNGCLFPLACVFLQMSECSARAQLAEVQEQLAGLTADHNTAQHGATN
jgi:hypothetical protein